MSLADTVLVIVGAFALGFFLGVLYYDRKLARQLRALPSLSKITGFKADK